MTLTRITSDGITDAAIVNADINASAAIAGSKISPDFGSQDIETTGNATVSRLKIEGANIPKIEFTDADDNPDYSINVNSGQFNIIDATNSANRFRINTDGHIDIAGNVDFGAGIDVTGTITTTSTIEASNHIQITHTQPSLYLTDSNDNPDYVLRNNGGQFIIRDDTSGATRLAVNTNGSLSIAGTTVFGAGIDVTGNITTSGTVDGVDIAALNTTVGTKLANIVEDTSPQLGGDLDTNSFEIFLDAGHSLKLATNQGQIYHSGSQMYIGTNDLRITNYAVNETMAKFVANGAVELFHNDNKKFETTSYGISVSGEMRDDRGNIRDIQSEPLSGTHSSRTLVAADAGKVVVMSGNLTLPAASGGGPFGGGSTITILNKSGSAITLTQASGLTLYNTADATTGNRTLAARGIATVYYMYGGNEAYISGAGLS